MSLTHYALLNAQPREKAYKLFDGHGLYLQVAPSGGKWWRVKYRFGGREQCLSLGTFPAVALKAARQRCEELRAKLVSGVDPAAERRLAKQQLRTKDESFEAIAREWYATFSPNWAPSHGDRVLRRLETYVFPWVGKVPIREVKSTGKGGAVRGMRRAEEIGFGAARGVFIAPHQIAELLIWCGTRCTPGTAPNRALRSARARSSGRPKDISGVRDSRELGASLTSRSYPA